MDHFKFLAPFYDRVIRSYKADRLINMTSLPVAGILLDAAGGTGRVAQSLIERATRVIVVDLSPRMLKEASVKDGLITVCAQTEHLPFSDKTLERIIMVDALHHVQDQVQTAHELWRIIKPGGCIVIEEPDIRKVVVKLVALFEKIALMRSRFLSGRHIAQLFNHPKAEITIENNGHTSWVIIKRKYA